MRILSVDTKPIHEITYRSAASGGRVEERSLPIIRAYVDKLPTGVEAILACSDLQGHEVLSTSNHPERLLGEVLAEEIEILGELGEIPPPQRLGIFLLGDLFARPDRLGSRGDVRPVWRAFAERFRWVAGVRGNHDDVGDNAGQLAEFGRETNAYLLDGDTASLGGLRVAGIGGVIGDARRPGRIEMGKFTAMIRKVQAAAPDVLLLHEGPDVPSLQLLGNPKIREVLDGGWPTLIICGHVNWAAPLAMLDRGSQVINVDGRVILLTDSKIRRGAS